MFVVSLFLSQDIKSRLIDLWPVLKLFWLGDLTGPKRDSNGVPCGEGLNMGKSLLYVQNPDGIFTQLFLQERSHTRQSICVAECPDFNYSPLEDGKPTKEIQGTERIIYNRVAFFYQDYIGVLN